MASVPHVSVQDNFPVLVTDGDEQLHDVTEIVFRAQRNQRDPTHARTNRYASGSGCVRMHLGEARLSSILDIEVEISVLPRSEALNPFHIRPKP